MHCVTYSVTVVTDADRFVACVTQTHNLPILYKCCHCPSQQPDAGACTSYGQGRLRQHVPAGVGSAKKKSRDNFFLLRMTEGETFCAIKTQLRVWGREIELCHVIDSAYSPVPVSHFPRE